MKNTHHPTYVCGYDAFLSDSYLHITFKMINFKTIRGEREVFLHEKGQKSVRGGFPAEWKNALASGNPSRPAARTAMFVGNLTPLLIITGTCGIASGEFASLQLALRQNAMLVAGIVTLVQLFSISPIGGNVPIVMGTSSGFIGV